MIHYKTNKQLLMLLDEMVYGHTQAKKALIALVNRSKKRYYQKWGLMIHNDHLLKTSKCLLVGGSGTGKTYLVECLNSIVDFPLLKVDASKFNPTGASGGIKPDDLVKMITKKARDILISNQEKYFSLQGVLDQMVVFVDEFDKMSGHYEGTGNKWNEHTQTGFLTLFENYDELSGVSWIFAGAFSGMEQHREKTKSLGFTCGEKEKEEKPITDEDIIKYGMVPELIGRLNYIVQLDTLTEEDFYNIMIDTIIPNKMMELSYFKIDDLNLDEPDIRDLARRAADTGQGVRWLQREMNKHLLDAEFNYEEWNYNDLKEDDNDTE